MPALLRRSTLTISTLILAVVLAACASDAASDGQPSRASETASERDMAESESAFNDADVTFLQMMIPHHEQANEMAEMVEGNTDRPELAELASTILSTQTAEIEQMNGLLEAAGEEAGMGGMDMGSMDMPGMMDEAQMAELMQLRDVEFDLAFLDMMTEHHNGAIEMAETLLADGEHPEVTQLAQEIIDAQQAEIDQMADWRTAWA